jgi:hypothetical protein
MLITEENFSGVVCRDSGFVQQSFCSGSQKAAPAEKQRSRRLASP